MKKNFVQIAIILLIFFVLTGCGPTAPAPVARTTQNTVPPPPPPAAEITETTVIEEETPEVVLSEAQDPFEGLSFKNGWARIPHNATLFGGHGDDQINDITPGGPGAVAVGISSENGDINADVWFTTDGINWGRVDNQVDLGGPGTQIMNAVAAGSNGIVAVGVETIKNSNNAAVWFSEEGLEWTRIPETGTTFGDEFSQSMANVTAYKDGFVAVGVEKTGTEIRGAVWLSPNGIAWQRVSHSEEELGGLEQFVSLNEVIAVGETLIAAGSIQFPGVNDMDIAVWLSHDDGRTWTRMTDPRSALGDPGAPRYQLVSGIAQANNNILVIGTEQNIAGTSPEPYINGVIWQSANGTEWERIYDHKPDYHLQTMTDIVATDLGFVIVGYDSVGEQTQAAAWISTDGESWTQVPHFESIFGGNGFQQMSAISTGMHGLIAVGSTTENGDLDAAVWIYVPEK